MRKEDEVPLGRPDRSKAYTVVTAEEALRMEGGVIGPGTHLKLLLQSLGVLPRGECLCKERMVLMDEQGTAWCKENRETIAGWLKEESDRRGWWEKVKAAGHALKAPGLALQMAADPYGSLVDEALRRAEAEHAVARRD